jgi:two-component system sensor histidine kinase ChvG
VLRRLLANSTIRGRIIDPEGNLVVDSRFLYGGGDIIQSDLPPRNAGTPNFLVRWWNAGYDWFFAYDYPLQKEYSLDNGKDFPEVAAPLMALNVRRGPEARHRLVSAPVQSQGGSRCPYA